MADSSGVGVSRDSITVAPDGAKDSAPAASGSKNLTVTLNRKVLTYGLGLTIMVVAALGVASVAQVGEVGEVAQVGEVAECDATCADTKPPHKWKNNNCPDQLANGKCPQRVHKCATKGKCFCQLTCGICQTTGTCAADGATCGN